MEMAMSMRDPTSDPLDTVLLAAPLLEALDSEAAAHLRAAMTRRVTGCSSSWPAR
jgi:hypothetical protein